jgi:branched-subunit amino acid ABC-type transport system permease component
VLRRLNYNPEATIVATIGLLYILQQAALTFYGPDARPVRSAVQLPRAAALVRLFRLQAVRDRRASLVLLATGWC